MNLSGIIYDCLLVEEAVSRDVTLEDVILYGCFARHAFRLDATPGEWNPQSLLLKRIETGAHALIQRYLRGTYGERFQNGYTTTQGDVVVEIDGFLDTRVVNIVLLSTLTYNTAKPPTKAILATAAKAFYTGKTEALLITMNRDNQDWTFWKITEGYKGAFEQGTKELRRDVLTVGKTQHTDWISQDACRHCPYTSTCRLTVGGRDLHLYPETFPTLPALEQRAEADGHLWSLNSEKNDRVQKAIHPSSFSTSDCDRQIFYDLKGVEQREKVEPGLRRIFDFGHCCHDAVQGLLSIGVPGFAAEVRAVHPELRISGSCDGRFGEYGLEIKSIGIKGFVALQKVKPEHEKQATIYAAILGLIGVYYLYLCKELGEIHEFPSPFNKTVWVRQATRATNIGKAADTDQIPPPIEKDYVCAKCKYAWMCKPDVAADHRKRGFK